MRRPKHPLRGHTFRHARGEFGRVERRHFGQSSSEGDPQVISPFGGLPRGLANQSARQFGNPLSAYFGAEPTFGPGRRGRRQQRLYDQRMSSMREGDSPLAQYARQAGGFLPQVFGQAQGAGQQIASLAPGLFDMFRGQIDTALQQLPGLQNTAAGQTQAAQQMLREQQSPIASQALYQNALRQGIEGTRGAAAGRGLLDAGSAQATEETMGRDLAAQFAQNQFANQQAALGGVQGALSSQAGLLPMGAQLAGQLGNALPGLQQALAAGYQMPQQALQQVFQQFAAYQNPQLALLGLTSPQVAQQTRGGGWNFL